jgi:hypothetical protein
MATSPPTTYDPTLQSDLDYTRFLIRDIATPFHFSDDEILGVLADQSATGQARKFYAAADLLSILAAALATTREDLGVRRKKVSKLELEWGADEDTLDAINARVCYFRARGGYLLARSSKVFRVMPRGSRYPAGQ